MPAIRKHISALNTLRVIGYAAHGQGLIYPFAALVMLPFIVIALRIEPDAVIASVLGISALVCGLIVPALFGAQHLYMVKKHYGNEVKDELFQRFTKVKPGEFPDFCLTQVVTEHAARKKERNS